MSHSMGDPGQRSRYQSGEAIRPDSSPPASVFDSTSASRRRSTSASTHPISPHIPQRRSLPCRHSRIGCHRQDRSHQMASHLAMRAIRGRNRKQGTEKSNSWISLIRRSRAANSSLAVRWLRTWRRFNTSSSGTYPTDRRGRSRIPFAAPRSEGIWPAHAAHGSRVEGVSACRAAAWAAGMGPANGVWSGLQTAPWGGRLPSTR
jgi:hypothetical protein